MKMNIQKKLSTPQLQRLVLLQQHHLQKMKIQKKKQRLMEQSNNTSMAESDCNKMSLNKNIYFVL